MMYLFIWGMGWLITCGIVYETIEEVDQGALRFFALIVNAVIWPFILGVFCSDLYKAVEKIAERKCS